MRPMSALGPMSPDRWLVPGTPTFALYFEELSWRFNTRQFDERTAQQLADRQIKRLMERVAQKHGRNDAATVEDLCQDLKVRVAEMDAASKYDPAKGSPRDHLSGIADMVGMEKFVRRKPPRAASLEAVPEPTVDGEQFGLRVRRAERADLKRMLRCLTPGERRAVEAQFGRLPDSPPPTSTRTRRPRRPNDPDVLRHVVEKLRKWRGRRRRQ